MFAMDDEIGRGDRNVGKQERNVAKRKVVPPPPSHDGRRELGERTGRRSRK